MSKLRIVFTGSLFVMLILSVIWGRGQRIDPFTAEVDYGFPLIWGTQSRLTESIYKVFALIITERSTDKPMNQTAAAVEREELGRYLVAGSVQEWWRVNLLNLVFDLVFWIGLMISVPAIIGKLRIPRIQINVSLERLASTDETDEE